MIILGQKKVVMGRGQEHWDVIFLDGGSYLVYAFYKKLSDCMLTIGVLFIMYVILQ